MMRFDPEKKETVILDPREKMARKTIPVEIRRDPLTGRTSRICHFMKFEWKKPDLDKLVAGTQETCPFCPDKVMQITPKFPEAVLPEGRMVSGRMVLFPNIAPYDSIGAVAVMGGRHYIPLAEIEPERMAEAFRLAMRFFRRMEAIGHPEAVYHLVNWNYMPPSGSTVIHPHLQVFSTSSAPNLMRQELEGAKRYSIENGRSYWDDFLKAESESDRFLGTIGRTAWFSSYAPLGAAGDVLAVVDGVSNTLDLSEEDLWSLAKGLEKTMRAYDRIGIFSFNMNFFTGAKGDDDTRFHLLFSPRIYYNQALGTPDAGALRTLFNESVCMAYPEDICRRLKPDFAA